jgi:phenylacetic acid degradation operon negative regulatory protein
LVTVFTIEEIFPDETAGSVRLPRRQAGSPQGLAVTLIADYTMSTRAWLPSAAIVALLGEFGVTSGAARTTISRLARRGVLEGSRQGRHSSYRLSQPAIDSLSIGGGGIAAFAANQEAWDGWWSLVTFSIPQEVSTQRRTLRDALRWQGYAPLYDGVWVSPRAMAEEELNAMTAVTAGSLTVFRARHLDVKAQAASNPIDAWDIAGIARQYELFNRRWGRLVPRIAAGRITGAAAVRARTEVMDTYRRFPTIDPLLPIELLPPRWPRAHARELFVAVYDGLAAPALAHVRAVVAQVTDEPHDEIRPHTIAEMTAMAARTQELRIPGA